MTYKPRELSEDRLETVKRKMAFHSKLEPCKCAVCYLIATIESKDARLKYLTQELERMTSRADSWCGEYNKKRIALDTKDKEIENLKISLRGIESTHAEFVDDMVKTQSSLSRLMEAGEKITQYLPMTYGSRSDIVENLERILEEIRKEE